ncbi:CRISPR-associated helicase Cas3' [Tropicimonas sp. IMCC34043]|uniref:CRISPR-associated helicase Cas3' n=1 Tax=Tropicimonas sp. IMCC34043 TaxID=2248760 RepID=UPI0013006E82|nr:CRISPR-associated helicase Cas3' [Tropicimonas sp. IMCC34043]
MEKTISRWPGKSVPPEGGPEHPAIYHMLDVAAVAERLIGPFGWDAALQDALVLLAALHDLGKIGEGFRAMLREGKAQPAGLHWEVTEALLRHHDTLIAERLGSTERYRLRLYAATAGHHGRPPTRDVVQLRRSLDSAGQEALADSARTIEAFLALWPKASLDGLDREGALALSWWLPGLVSAADWVGSNSAWFPPCDPTVPIAAYLERARDKAGMAVELAGLTVPAPSGGKLFDFDLRPMQAACAEVPLPDGPMLAVIEDETGVGKTEAALILAQRMMAAGKGRGLFFALPTMATANAMFARAQEVVSRMFAGPHSLVLAHGRARLSGPFRTLVARQSAGTDEPVCTEWLADNRRRALLANVGVGTVDQALLSILPTKFSTLRHFGLSSKILIVDEVHELGEPYMAAELAQLLRAHRMAGGSAILLTATLPMAQRKTLLAAYDHADSGDAAYPALTLSHGQVRREFPQQTGARGQVSVHRLPDPEAAVALLAERAGQGAACLWVRNAVDDAIAGVEALRAAGVEADLLHARFALCDRLRHETAALERFGKAREPRPGRVLVATQVVESSLDLDFDVMVSDLAPMAALIQRAGRLWRHMDRRPAAMRAVPAPLLHVVSPDPDSVEDDQWLHRVLDRGAWVYPLDLQWRTARVLFGIGRIEAPSGLRALIEAVHGADAEPVPGLLETAETERIGKGYSAANQAWRNVVVLEDGYRMGGAGAEDTKYPTRLGRPQKTLLLARWQAGRLVPHAGTEAGDMEDAWQLSEVQAAEHRLQGLDLPDQAAPEVAAMTAGWPEWRRAAVHVCPMAPDGEICTGLRYDPERGLL